MHAHNDTSKQGGEISFHLPAPNHYLQGRIVKLFLAIAIVVFLFKHKLQNDKPLSSNQAIESVI